MNRVEGETKQVQYGPEGGAPLIFNRPDLQSKRQRWLYWVLTLIAWAIWVYLWVPLITLVGWYLGFRAFIREIVLPDPATVISTGALYLAIILVLGTLLVSWSRYNLRRFGGEDRRSHAPEVADEEMRRWFGVSAESLARLRAGKVLTVDYDEQAVVQSVESGTRSTPWSVDLGRPSIPRSVDPGEPTVPEEEASSPVIDERRASPSRVAGE